MIMNKKKFRELLGAISFLIPPLIYSQRVIASDGSNSCVDFDDIGFSMITIIVGLVTLIFIVGLPNRTPAFNVWERLNQSGYDRIFEVLTCLVVKLFGSFTIGMFVADYFICGGSLWPD